MAHRSERRPNAPVSAQRSRQAGLRRVERSDAWLQGTRSAVADAGGCLECRIRLPCDTHRTVALGIVRRPKATPIHELERYMRCKDCSQVRGYPYKRGHLVALRPTKISALDPPSTWWPVSANLYRANQRGLSSTMPTLTRRGNNAVGGAKRCPKSQRSITTMTKARTSLQ